MKKSIEYRHEVTSSRSRCDIVGVLIANAGKIRICKGAERFEMSRSDARKLACELLDFIDSTTDADEHSVSFVARPEA